MKKLYSATTNEILAFKWKDTRNSYKHPVDMDTRHLFFTLRMIWNHSAPQEWRFRPYKRYTFSPFYTTKYMRLAVIAIIHELVKREDILPVWKVELDQMIAYLNNAHLKEVNDQKNTTSAVAKLSIAYEYA